MDRASAHGSALCQSGGTPLNQGNNGTCSAYAFGCVTSTNLMNKYDVAISAEKIKDDALEGAQTMKGEDVRNGSTMSELGETWNTSHNSTTLKADIDKAKWYRLRVELKEIKSFDAALEKMRELQQAGLQMMIALKTDKKGHDNHAISAWQCDPIARTITAMNSWGAEQPTMTVTSENFLCAVTVDPIITHRAEGEEKTITYGRRNLHPTTERYNNMTKNFARVKKLEADARARQAAEEAQQVAVDAQRAAQDALQAAEVERRAAEEAQRRAEAALQAEQDARHAAEAQMKVERRRAEREMISHGTLKLRHSAVQMQLYLQDQERMNTQVKQHERSFLLQRPLMQQGQKRKFDLAATFAAAAEAVEDLSLARAELFKTPKLFGPLDAANAVAELAAARAQLRKVQKL